MTDWMRRIIENKTIVRRQLAALPFAEKLHILERLRDRSLEIAANRLHAGRRVKVDGRPEGG